MQLRHLRPLATGAFAFLALGLAEAPSTAFAVTMTTTESTPMNMVSEPPCPVTEPIALEGPLHETVHTTVNPDGTVHTTIDQNFQGVAATGLITGAKYSTMDTATVSVNLGPPPSTQSIVARVHYFRSGEFVGKLPDDFYVKMTNHVTMNANGTVTATVAQADVDCR